MILPSMSPATHSAVEGQEIARSSVNLPGPSTLVGVQAATPPVGLVEVMTCPKSSTATQKVVVGQLTPLALPAGLMRSQEPAVVGVVEISSCPMFSGTTQSVVLGQA